jgi:hypothetical protein
VQGSVRLVQLFNQAALFVVQCAEDRKGHGGAFRAGVFGVKRADVKKGAPTSPF